MQSMQTAWRTNLLCQNSLLYPRQTAVPNNIFHARFIYVLFRQQSPLIAFPHGAIHCLE
jgi:hypothetical protein